MNQKEQRVREAGRHLHICNERVNYINMMNTPIDPDEAMALSEELAVARAEVMKAQCALGKAQSDFAKLESDNGLG